MNKFTKEDSDLPDDKEIEGQDGRQDHKKDEKVQTKTNKRFEESEDLE